MTNPTDCRCPSHYDEKKQPLQDSEVCPREKAWRRYVEARDKMLAERKKKMLEDLENSLENPIFRDQLN